MVASMFVRRALTPAATAAVLGVLAVPVAAQDPATITGQVTDPSGQPLLSATLVLEGMNLGTLTDENGRYVLVVPASRVEGQTVTFTVSLLGYSSSSAEIPLNAGRIQQDFALERDPLRLEEIVVTGQGLEQERAQLATSINSVTEEAIQDSQEPNIVTALAGKAPNVDITSSAGDPGSGAYIRIRGPKSMLGDGQPLFVVDGTPVDNASNAIEGDAAGTVEANRLLDLNPQDVQSVEILKGAAASAIYGSRAADGVVLITTRRGRPGENRVTYRMSYGMDQVTGMPALQQSYGQGLDGAAIGLSGDVCGSGCPLSWGLELGQEAPTYDHANEIFRTGQRLEHYLNWSGGSDRTTYFLSIGRLDHRGVIDGNSEYERTTFRLNGSHAFADDLRLSGNFAYTTSDQVMVQQGSNISGLLLGALRSPADFDNLPYRHPETGLHRSYRNPNPATLTEGRGYDNPFWIAREMPNTSDVGRYIGTVALAYHPLSWLRFDYNFGIDYSADERRSVFPKSSSNFPNGRLIRADFVSTNLDHNLLATIEREFSRDVLTSLTVGQNLNHREFTRYQVNGQTLIYGADQLDYTVNRLPNEFQETVRTDGYFAQLDLDLYDQLFVSGALRLDGSSTFGRGDNRFLYPKGSVAWNVTDRLSDAVPGLSYAKLRTAYGVAGKQPPAYSNVSAYVTGTLTDGWLTPNGLESIYQGNEGILSPNTLANPEIEPERTTEFEAGLDVAFLDGRLSFGGTYYQNHTTDAILEVDVPTSTGYLSQWENAAEFENEGWELVMDAIAVQTDDITWSIGANWATNQSCVLDLAGAEELALAGFVGSTSSVVAPERDANGDITRCHPFGALFGNDFIRFGRGITVNGVDIDEAYDGWSSGDLYVHDTGYPLQDPRSRVIGDPNPDWTAGLRTSVTVADNLRIAGTLDVKYGGDMWNGTKGALYYFGTHDDTESYHGAGQDVVFGESFFEDERVAGPGAGRGVPLNWASWFLEGVGSGFTGPASQFVEDAGFVKLRDVSVSYRFDDLDWLESVGFGSAELRVAGRNLKTWTDYTGIDPESNLFGEDLGRGIDYFNNPQARSFVFDVTINR